ncbi:ATP-binding response regulator [Anaerofustis stercorihominis]|uniref:Circadian input-output histidine kinase CikA n=1 Tax=Anaerofustis stercorihominis TaxID=214853 RepID=A0A3E3E1C4_9FIRM|nr:ATP-binding protein [Anaerofustis stercorihominis]RGD74979.1 response regulator [Anaerofustis stercorihominis]
MKYKLSKNDLLVAGLTALIVLFSFALVFFYNYQQTHDDMIKSLQDRALAIYNSVDSNLNIKSFDAVKNNKDMNSSIYKEQQEFLNNIRHATGVRYLYTAKKNSKGEIIYLVDGLDLRADDFAFPGTKLEDEVIPAMERALEGKVILPDSIIKTNWGKIFVAYFPIHAGENHRGKVIGLLGMEFDANHQYDTYLKSAIFTPIVAIITCLFAMFIMVKFYRKITDLYNKATVYAQNASNAKGRFLSNISHEMRTPLNAISGMTRIGKENIDDKKEVTQCFEKIDTSVNYLTNLINDVLDISRIESGKTKIENRPFNLDTLIKNIITIIQNQANEKEINFICKYDLKSPYLIGDELHLQQILVNIIGNAIKYTHNKGKVEVIISDDNIDNNKSKVNFTISDNGIGIEAKQLPTIFKAFERADNAMEQQYKGTGLGLAISYNLVKMMGGELKVRSEVDKGSSFFFDLELNKINEEEYDRYIKLKNKYPNHNIDKLRGIKILLAEDNEINREISKYVLEQNGVIVEEAVDGKEALYKFEQSKKDYYSAILMDIKMPVMDGHEATKAIRNLPHPNAKDIPIIAVSANAFEEDIERSLMCGMNDHISKPIDFDDLIKALDKYIK